MTFHAWQSAGNCARGPQPGTAALLASLIDRHDDEGAYSLGIFACRTVRGSRVPSVHGEGRALDLGLPVGKDGRGTEAGHAIVDLLVEHAWALGITFIVYDRRKWGAKYPGGAPYGGTHPHYNHLHVEQTREHARALNLTTVEAILSRGEEARHYAQGVIGVNATDAEHGRPIARFYNLGLLDVADNGRLVSLQSDHLGKPATVAFGIPIGAQAEDWAKRAGLEDGYLPLSGGTRDETALAVAQHIAAHPDPSEMKRRGRPW